MTPRRCLIAAGGTGGHIFPARAAADALIARGRQVRLVEKFMRAVRADRDQVEQMIMGAGKTTVVSPLLSRSLVLQLQSLTEDDVRALLRRAVADPRGLAGAVALAPDAEDALVRLAAGDARRALTALEAAADGLAGAGGSVIDVPAVERAVTEATVRYDRQGDQHYDVISAFKAAL